MSNKIFSKLAMGLILSFAIIPVAMAGYKPPQNQIPPKYSSKGLGTRGGCSNPEQKSLKLFAPQEHYVGQSISSHPTFAWLFSESQSFPLEFRLYQYDSDNKLSLLYKFETQSKSEIMTLSLPKDRPALVKGTKYFWQIAISCNPAYPSADIVQRADFEIKDLPPNLDKRISQTENKLTRSQLYAENGFWYDALKEAMQTGKTEEVDELLKELN